MLLTYYTPSFTLTNTDNLADSIYTISLTVGDTDNGCDSTFIIDNIIVNPVPQANFTTDIPTSALTQLYKLKIIL